MLMTLFSGQRAIRIDRDQPRPATLRFLCSRPEMQVRRDRICTPDQDEFAFLEVLGVHAEARAVGIPKARRAGRRANRPVEPRRTERVEKTRGDAFALHEPHRAGIAVRNNGFGRASCDRLQAICGQAQCLVPADCFEASLAFAADASQRREQPILMVRAFGIARHFRAKHALRRRMVGIAADLDGLAILDGNAHRASVGTIVRADGTGEFGGGIHAKVR